MGKHFPQKSENGVCQENQFQGNFGQSNMQKGGKLNLISYFNGKLVVSNRALIEVKRHRFN